MSAGLYSAAIERLLSFEPGVARDASYRGLSFVKSIAEMAAGRASLMDLPASCGFVPARLRRLIGLRATRAVIVANGTEVLHCLPLAAALRSHNPDCAVIVLTRNTRGGHAARLAQDNDLILLPYPMESLRTATFWRDFIRPSLLVFMEDNAGLGPRLLSELKSLPGLRAVVVNACRTRPETSGLERLRAAFYGRRLWAAIDEAGAVSEDARRYLIERGLAPEKVRVIRNIKYDAPVAELAPAQLEALRRRLGLATSNQLVVFASTHPEEAETLVEAYRKLPASGTSGRVRALFAPRQLAHCDALERLLNARGIATARVARATATDDDEKALILDTFGELRDVYALATVVVMGGSFHPVLRGHSPIEPAQRGKPVVIGPHCAAFEDVVSALERGGGILRLLDSERLASSVEALLGDGGRREALARRAREIVEANRGSLEEYAPMFARAVNREALKSR